MASEEINGTVALEPASAELPAAVQLAGQAWTAMFARISAPGGQKVRLALGDGQPWECTSCAPDESIGPGFWLDAFHGAIIVRDHRFSGLAVRDAGRASSRGPRPLARVDIPGRLGAAELLGAA